MFQIWPQENSYGHDGSSKCAGYLIAASQLLPAIRYCETLHGPSLSVCGIRSLRSLRGIGWWSLGDNCGSLQLLSSTTGLCNCVSAVYGYAELEGRTTRFVGARLLPDCIMVSFLPTFIF